MQARPITERNQGTVLLEIQTGGETNKMYKIESTSCLKQPTSVYIKV